MIYEEFIFETFDEAMKIHKKLFEMMRNNGVVTYADLYFLMNPNETNCKDVYQNMGWTSLWGSVVEPYDGLADGDWVLRMPKHIRIRKGER